MRKRAGRSMAWVFVVALGLTLPATAVVWAGSDKAPLSREAQAGKKLYQANCAVCHYADQTANKVGPGLKGLLKNKLMPDGKTPATVANVLDRIEKGAPNADPMPMPAFKEKFSKTEMDELIAYLKTL